MTPLGVLSLLLAACGGFPSALANTSSTTNTTDGPAAPSTTGGPGGHSAQQSALAFVACVRSHGVTNFPGGSDE